MTRPFVLSLVLLAAAQLHGQTITPSFDATRWVPARERIVLELSQPTSARLAIFAGTLDITPLFEITPTSLRYRAGVPPLPPGEQEITVYAVPDEGDWQELGRFPIRVLTRRGFEKSMAKPSLDLTNKGQLDQDQNPAESFSAREKYQDLTAQAGLATEHQRGDFTFRTQANVTGVSYVNEALRFGEKGVDAPRVDLAAYRVEMQKGLMNLAVGHVGFGNQRHLVNGFNSRGAVLTLGAGKPVYVSLGIANGTSIVGWDNVVGLQEQQHRMLSTTIGFELIPSRPGGARLEASLLNGSLLPLNGFTDGGVRSAEKSRGAGLRLLLSDRSQRITIDGGWVRSRFRPQQDLQLEEGLAVTAIPETERDAAYLDATLALVNNRKVGSQQASLSATLSFERVEPLFRSVATYAQADLLRGGLSLNGMLGPLALQVGTLRSEDNLEDIRSLLKTKTNQTSANVALALSTLFAGKRGSRWIPTLTVGGTRTKQYGAWLPENAGYSETHVPDQISLAAQGALEWQVQPVRFGFRGSWSDQDNRQVGRVLADFLASSGSAFLGFTVGPRLDVTYEFSLEEQRSIEFDTRERNRRHGVTASWRLFGDVALAGNYSQTYGRDGNRTNERRSSDAFAELSSGFRLWRTPQQQNRSRIFVRYSNRDASTFDRLFDIANESDGWALTSGVNVSVY